MVTLWSKRLGLLFALPLALLLTTTIWLAVKVVSHGQTDNETHLAAKRDYLERLAHPPTQSSTSQRPNIIFVLYDDLGYGDLGFTGSKAIKTPVIDQLAAEGTVLNNFYAPAPVCTPSRVGFLTGRHAVRAGLPNVVFPTGSGTSLINILSNENIRLPAEEITMADILKASGYQTAMIGKWHLGDRAPSLPNNFGFDQFFGALYSNDMEPFALYKDEKIVIEAPADQTKLNAAYTKEAVNFIISQKTNTENGKPFFLYFAHNFPHIPLHAAKGQKGKSDAGLYGDVVEGLDWGMSQIITQLKIQGLYDNTIIILTSDNGPWYQGSPGNSRGRKGKTFEGGMHVPFLINWPAQLEGGRSLDGMAMGTDLLPTLLEWLDLPAPDDRSLDGKSLNAMLQGSEATPHNYLYYFANSRLMAVSDGQYKYHDTRNVLYGPTNSPIGLGIKKGPWLFDMTLDHNESYDVSDNKPDQVARFAAVLDEKREELRTNLRGWKER